MSSSLPESPKPKSGVKLSPKQTIIILVILALILVGVFAKNHDSKNSDKAKTTNNSSQSASQSSKATYQIKELGVAVELPSTLQGMTYTYIKPSANSKGKVPPIVTLALNDYTSLANSCLGTPSNTPQHFAVLLRLSGNGASGDSITLKQFKTFKIVLATPNASKIIKCKDVSKQQDFDKLNKNINGELMRTFSAAQQT